jgi:hypothetical protein
MVAFQAPINDPLTWSDSLLIFRRLAREIKLRNYVYDHYTPLLDHYLFLRFKVDSTCHGVYFRWNESYQEFTIVVRIKNMRSDINL